jgi:ABC-type branched-subunit amino acid transport system substrate-binding protein
MSSRSPAFLLPLAGIVFAACAVQPVKRGYTPSQVSTPETDLFQREIRKIQAHYSKGEYGKAIEGLNRIQEPALRSSEKTEYWNLKGLVRLAEKNTNAAIINFKRALGANPYPEHESYYQFNLATAYLEAGKVRESKELLGNLRLEGMASGDQKKVLALKERIQKSESGAAIPKPVAPPPGSGQVPVAAVSPSPPPAPVEVYSGPVNPKRIGILLPLSGKYENFGKRVQKAVELAFQSSTLEEAKTFELISVDSGDSAESHETGLKKLIEEQEVVAVIGPLLGKHLDSLRSKAAYYQIPLVSVAQVQGVPDPQVFSCSVSITDQTAKVARYAVQTLGLTRFAILGPDNKAGQEVAQSFWSEAEKLNAEIRAFELYDPELTDFREPVDKALGLHYTEVRSKELEELAEKRKELNITKKTMKTLQYFTLPPIIDFDAVFIADEARTAGQVIPTFAYRDAKSLKYFGISSWNSPQLVQRAGDLVEGGAFPVAFNTLNPPEESKRFYELFSNKYGNYPGEMEAVAFDAASLVLETLKEAPSSRAEFTKKLETRRNVEGASGKISVIEHRCSRDLALYRVRKSAFEAVGEP